MNPIIEEVIMVIQGQDHLFQDQDLLFQVIEGLHITSQDSLTHQPTGQEEEDGTEIIIITAEPTMKYISVVSIIVVDNHITKEEEEEAIIPLTPAVQVNNTTEDRITDTVEEVTLRQTLAIQVPIVKGLILKVLEDFQTAKSQMNQQLNLKKKVQLIKKLAYHKNQSVHQQLLQ